MSVIFFFVCFDWFRRRGSGRGGFFFIRRFLKIIDCYGDIGEFVDWICDIVFYCDLFCFVYVCDLCFVYCCWIVFRRRFVVEVDVFYRFVYFFIIVFGGFC